MVDMSALEMSHDKALYKSTYTLLYYYSTSKSVGRPRLCPGLRRRSLQHSSKPPIWQKEGSLALLQEPHPHFAPSSLRLRPFWPC